MKIFSTNKVIYGQSILPLLNQNRNSVEMTKKDILRIEDDFVKSAIRAKKEGFDGFEIYSTHLYLLITFLSPQYDKEMKNKIYSRNYKKSKRSNWK